MPVSVTRYAPVPVPSAPAASRTTAIRPAGTSTRSARLVPSVEREPVGVAASNWATVPPTEISGGAAALAVVAHSRSVEAGWASGGADCGGFTSPIGWPSWLLRLAELASNRLTGAGWPGYSEIGRASCRERGERWVVGG